MERRSFNRRNFGNGNKEPVSGQLLQKKSLAEKEAPDLTDFMNDMFFGTINKEKKVYNLTGSGSDHMAGGRRRQDQEDEDEDYLDFDSSTRSTNSRLTQEWLEEAKRMVASSPPSPRCDSPSRFGGSPRFAVSQLQPPNLSLSTFDRRDPLSRSCRRNRAGEGYGGEILTKSAEHSHSRNNSQSDALPDSHTGAGVSPASAVQKWFSNILKPTPSSGPTPPPVPDPNPPLPPRLSTHRRSRFENQTAQSTQPTSITDPNTQTLPPRQSVHRKSRFRTDPAATQPQGIPPQPLSRRNFVTAPPPTQLLSPPKHLTESVHRRSISSSTCALSENQVLSPPRNLVESARRRSISSSTCSTDRNSQNPSNVNGQSKDLNGFLKEQRIKIAKLLRGEINGNAKIVLSGPSNSTCSMLSAICYSWLLDTQMRNSKEDVDRDGGAVIVLPVMNVRSGKMWKQHQAAWLFHHVGIDAKALLFSEEVDLEALMMAKKLSILVVGQDILISSGEVGSQCSILTDNYCEDAYDLLQTPVLKKLLLAGILLDTQNLNTSTKLSTTRDAEAVQLLSVGCAPNYGNALYDQLMQDHRDSNFVEALRNNYGKPRNEGNNSRAPLEHRISERKAYPDANLKNSDKNSDVKTARTALSSKPAQAPVAAPAQAADASRGKNKFSLAKLFGFGK